MTDVHNDSDTEHSESAESDFSQEAESQFKIERVENDITQLEHLLRSGCDNEVNLKSYPVGTTSLDSLLLERIDVEVSYRVQLHMRRTFKQFAFFDIIILNSASSHEVLAVRPMVQAIITSAAVGDEVFQNTVLKVRLGDELVVSGIWVIDNAKKTSLNFGVRSIQLARKYDRKGYVVSREFPRGSRESGAEKKHKYTKAKTRAGLVADWLLATFNIARLRAGTVLDIAGGAGYLAHALCAHGVAVTIVDPRTPRHPSRAERKRAARSGARLPVHIVSLFDEVPACPGKIRGDSECSAKDCVTQMQPRTRLRFCGVRSCARWLDCRPSWRRKSMRRCWHP